MPESSDNWNKEIQRIRDMSSSGKWSSAFCRPLFKALDIPKLAADIACGDIQVPATEGFLNGAFPPALLPLWATPAGTIIGYWKHWFTSERQISIVHHYGSTIYGRRNMTFEFARTLKQLMYLHLLELITNQDGITEDSRKLATISQIEDIEEIDRISMEAGKPSGFSSHKAFIDLEPLSCYETNTSEYNGDFPHEGMSLDRTSLSLTCEYEIHSGFKNSQPDFSLRERIASLPQAPPWLRLDEPRTFVFENLLRNGDFSGAWLTLNSIGWQLSQARSAIRKLSSAAADPTFHLLTETWCALPLCDSEEY